MKQFVLINFKTYAGGTGKKGIRLAKEIAKFKSKKYNLMVAPQLIDLKEIIKLKVPVVAQNSDAISFGSNTGGVLPEAIKEAGAGGVLINHSERRVKIGEIKKLVEICRGLGLISVVCGASLRAINNIVRFKPDYIAYEPKEFIGKNISVTSANPKVIVRAVQLVEKLSPKTNLLVGAGIHSRRDVLKAEELGAKGVLIAHKIVKAKRVGEVLKGMFN